jgi:hypothetical protein
MPAKMPAKKWLRQLQVFGRRRVDFHIRRNELSGDAGKLVTATVSSKEISVQRDSTAMADSKPELRVSFNTLAAAGKAQAVSGLMPDGGLTANIREDLHLKLKVKAAHERTTIGEILEEQLE